MTFARASTKEATRGWALCDSKVNFLVSTDRPTKQRTSTFAIMLRSKTGTVVTSLVAAWMLMPLLFLLCYLLAVVLVDGVSDIFVRMIRVPDFLELFVYQPSWLLLCNTFAYFSIVLVRFVYGVVLFASLLAPQCLLGARVMGWVYCLAEVIAHLVALSYNTPAGSDTLERASSFCNVFLVVVGDPAERHAGSRTRLYALDCILLPVFFIYPVGSSIEAPALMRAFRPFIGEAAAKDPAVEDPPHARLVSSCPKITTPPHP